MIFQPQMGLSDLALKLAALPARIMGKVFEQVDPAKVLTQ